MSLAERVPEGFYERPDDLDRALAHRAQGAAILAGGTDFYPLRVGRPLRDLGAALALDLSSIGALRAITEDADGHRIGALTTWTEIAEGKLPSWFDCLRQAAREVGGRQIQNRGTIAGNLCNASPAADGVPPLLALNASVELASLRGCRRLALGDFILGSRKTALEPDEIMTAILVPRPRHSAISGFAKLGSRRYLVISLVMAAALIEHEDGKILAASIAIGACSPVARRLPELEQALIGRELNPNLGQAVDPSQLRVLSPIDDPRASAAYRLDAAITLLGRLLSGLGSRA